VTRHFWVLIHRYAGLYMAAFLIVAGLTGSIMAFTPEIQNGLNPPLKVAQQSGARLDEFTLRERAQALVPQGLVTSLDLHRKPGEAYTARFEPRVDPATGKPFELNLTVLTLNPYSGAEISRLKEPDGFWPITRQNFMAFVIALHYRLAVPGSIGVWLFGIAALIWTIDCFVSAYLTFPLSVRRRADGKPRATKRAPRSWWARWKHAWMVKWSASTYRINFDLHRAGGLWVWLMLLVLAWSSVGFNLNEQVYMPVMKAVFRMPDPYGDVPTLDPPRPEPALAWREAHAVGQRLMAEQARRNGFNIEREEALMYIAEKGVFLYSVRSDRDVMDAVGATYVMFDAISGRDAGLILPTGQNLGNTINSWIFALHTATIWGLPFKIFVCAMGIVIAMLSITGVYLWLKKRRAIAGRRQRQSAVSVDSARSSVKTWPG